MAANFREKTSGSGIYYLPSADIQVFPSTYRNKVNGTIYDPEAKLNTELNYTRIPGYNKKESYIISWSGSNLEIVLHGYYFKIANLSLADCTHPFVGIKVESVPLLDPASGSTARTNILKAFQATSGAQETVLDIDIGGTAYFAGLAFTDEADDAGATYVLQLTDGNGHEYKGNRLPAIEANRNPAIADIFAGSFNTKLNTGEGAVADYAVTLGGHSKAQAEKSIAAGTGTIAKNVDQVVLGEYNADATDSLFIIGNGTADNARSNTFEVYKDGTVKAPTKFVSPALDVAAITGTGTNGALGITGATTFNNTVHITDTTAHTEIDTGALQVEGGVYIGDSLGVYKNLWTGGAVSFTDGPSGGSLDVAVPATFSGSYGLAVLDNNNYNIFSVDTSGVTIGNYSPAVNRTLYVFGPANVYKPLKIYDETNVTYAGHQFSTASFVTAGGAYITKKLVVASTDGAPDSGPGALDVAGGISVGQNVRIASTSEATAINDGALYVSGGAKLGKNLRVGTNARIGNNLEVVGQTRMYSDAFISGWLYWPTKDGSQSIIDPVVFGAYTNNWGGGCEGGGGVQDLDWTYFIPDELADAYIPVPGSGTPDLPLPTDIEAFALTTPTYIIFPKYSREHGVIYSGMVGTPKPSAAIKDAVVQGESELQIVQSHGPLLVNFRVMYTRAYGIIKVNWTISDMAGNELGVIVDNAGFRYQGILYRIN